MSLTPEEKAKSLIESYKPLVTTWNCYHDCPAEEEDILRDAKKCALIAVEEIIEVAWWSGNGVGLLGEPYKKSQKEYWQQVKESILKL
jgi:hypothetical protein